MSDVVAKDIPEQGQKPLTNTELFNRGRNNFSLDYYNYPEDLGNDDLKHWIQFTINVRGKSTVRLGNERIIDRVSRSADSAQLTEDELGQAALGAGVVGTAVAAGGISTFISESLKSKNQKSGGAVGPGPLRKAAPFALGAVAGGVLLTQDFLRPDTSYKISDVINLYVDGPPTVRYNAQYSNKDLGTIAGLAGGGTDAIASTEGASAVLMQFAKIPQMAGVNTADIIGASSKVALNPFKEVLFESIDFRAFNFKYKFMPKSKEEAKTVYKIIELFKFHMHPELSANKLFFIYPSEFEITYFFNNRPNNKDGGGYFHKFKPCVLENMDVTYGGDIFSSFGDGNPTEINVTLTFRETEILTKKQIKDGY